MGKNARFAAHQTLEFCNKLNYYIVLGVASKSDISRRYQQCKMIIDKTRQIMILKKYMFYHDVMQEKSEKIKEN